MSNERRRGPRVPIEMFVDERKEGELYFQHTANISKGGMYLENTIPHPLGTLINIEFALPGDKEKLKVKAQIVSITTDSKTPGMGLKFVGLSAEQVAKIDSFIDKMSQGGK